MEPSLTAHVRKGREKEEERKKSKTLPSLTLRWTNAVPLSGKRFAKATAGRTKFQIRYGGRLRKWR